MDLVVVSIVATAVLSAGVTLVLVSQRPSSSLTQSIGGDSWEQSTAIFDTRVKRRFPVGTPQSKLVAELTLEGFAPEWPSNDPEHEAVRYEGNFVCNVAARVFWQVDHAGRIKLIEGRYHEEGCL